MNFLISEQNIAFLNYQESNVSNYNILSIEFLKEYSYIKNELNNLLLNYNDCNIEITNGLNFHIINGEIQNTNSENLIAILWERKKINDSNNTE